MTQHLDYFLAPTGKPPVPTRHDQTIEGRPYLVAHGSGIRQDDCKTLTLRHPISDPYVVEEGARHRGCDELGRIYVDFR